MIKSVEEPVWVLVGDPSQTKDVSAINLAENHSVCLQIAQRFRTVATHHKLTSKPAGMPAELWNIVQIVIPRGSKMSLAVLFRIGFERLVLDSVRAPGKLLGCFCALFCIIWFVYDAWERKLCSGKLIPTVYRKLKICIIRKKTTLFDQISSVGLSGWF